MDLGSVLVLSLLWKGVFCDYKVTVPDPVTAQEGLCVLIPCQFTMKEWGTAAGSRRGYWFIDGDKKHDPAVASNDEKKKICEEFKGRFRLVGDVRKGDCSLSINDVRRSDGKKYFFRYEDSKFQFSYSNYPLRVTVVDLQDKPTIDLPPELIEGKNVSINCTAPGRCSGTPPNITWTAEWTFAHSTMNRSVTDANGTQSHISEISFQVTRKDNRKQLICTANFPTARASTKSNATLNVEYPPRNLKITTEDTMTQGQLSERENNSTEKILEGRSLTMKCSVESSPLAFLRWMKVGNKSLIESDMLSQNSLTLSLPHVTPGNDGQYLCVAKNQHGAVNSSLFVTVESKVPQAPSIAAMIGGGLAGIFVVAGVSLLGWLFVRRVRRTKNGNKGTGVKEEMVDDDTLIYSEIHKPPKSPIAAADHGAENKAGSDVTSTEPKENLYENLREDNLQYASIDFSNLKPGGKATAAPEETLYSEVNLH